MKDRKYPIVNIGLVSILTIFIILCMVTFATLSYMSADHDRQLGRKIAERTTEYYTAVEKANEKIAALDKKWQTAWESDPSHFAGQEEAFSIPIDTRSVLSVTLVSTDPAENNGHLYTIDRFQKTASTTWQEDDTLPLYSPERNQ